MLRHAEDEKKIKMSGGINGLKKVSVKKVRMW